VAGLKQPRDRFEKTASAKIIEVAAALRGFDQINRTKRGAWNSGFLQQCAASI